MTLLLSLLACGSTPTCPEGTVLLPAGPVRLGHDSPSASWHQPARSEHLEAFCVDRYEHPNREGERPTTGVSWEQARDLCAAEGKRLCTSAEWARACRGSEGRLYSYGSQYDRSTCYTPWEQGHPKGPPPQPAPSGQHAGCRSPEGVYDLNGNLSEWVQDPWTGPREGFGEDGAEAWRTLRGGTMWAKTFYGQDCTSRHGHPQTGWQNIDDGLRCCADPS